MAATSYEHIKYNGKKIQVDSAIRDGNGAQIDTNYAKKATTLAGYGITDAKIENGTITLGSNSVTPTSASSCVLLTTDQTINGIKTIMGDAPSTQPTGDSSTGVNFKFYGGFTSNGTAYENFQNNIVYNRENKTVGFFGPYQKGSTDSDGYNGFRLGLRNREDTTWTNFLGICNGSITWDGCIYVQPPNGNYTEGLRINRSPAGWSTILLGCTRDSLVSMSDAWLFSRDTSGTFFISKKDATASTGLFYGTYDTSTATHTFNVPHNFRVGGQQVVQLCNGAYNYTPGQWGTLTPANEYTGIGAVWRNGGAIEIAEKSGAIYMQLDGYYYQREGACRVLDVADMSTSSSFFNNGSGVTGSLTLTRLGPNIGRLDFSIKNESSSSSEYILTTSVIRSTFGIDIKAPGSVSNYANGWWSVFTFQGDARNDRLDYGPSADVAAGGVRLGRWWTLTGNNGGPGWGAWPISSIQGHIIGSCIIAW